MARRTRPSLRLNIPSPEFEKVLTTTSKPALRDAGNAVASNIQGIPVNVSVGNNRNGRAAAFVTLLHPKAIASQIKYGTLTRAAARAGLEVKRYRI